MSRASCVVVATAAIALVACGGGESSARGQLVDVTWQLQAIEHDSGTVTTVDDPTRYTVRFGADGTLNVRADCNACTGSYLVSGSSLTIGPLACTRAACPTGSLDTDYEMALSSVSSFMIDGGDLALAFPGGRLRYRAP